MTTAIIRQRLAYEIFDETIFTQHPEAIAIEEAEHILTSNDFKEETTNTIPSHHRVVTLFIYYFYVNEQN